MMRHFDIADAPELVDGCDSMRRGHLAKLCFVGPLRSADSQPRDGATGRPLPWNFGGEEMWVNVEERLSDGRYRGKLRNRPVAIDGAYDDELVFHPRQVRAIQTWWQRFEKILRRYWEQRR